MPTKLRTALVSTGVAAVTAVAVLGAATPAFAKSDTQLSAPRVADARHAFRLTVAVGDDAGARHARARLQLLGAHGRYQWLGTWERLRPIDRNQESCAFRVTDNHRGPAVFRAVVTGYATTNPVKVVIR
jgi:hypothetical protein